MNKKSESKIGEKNPMWKGNSVGYTGLHSWIKKRFPKPEFCNDCHKIFKHLDLANISQKYKRELSDWEWLCRKCHMTKDGRLEKSKRTQFKKGDSYWLGKHRTEATKKKLSETLKRLGIKPIAPWRGGSPKRNLI